MKKIHDVVICESMGEFLAYREGLRWGFSHSEMMSKAELDQAYICLEKASQLGHLFADQRDEALDERDEACGQLVMADAYSNALEEKLESAMYDRDCLRESLVICHEELSDLYQVFFNQVEKYHALENEHERLDIENTKLEAGYNRLSQENHDLRASNLGRQTVINLDALHIHAVTSENTNLKARLKKAEEALAAAGLVITILEVSGDSIKKLPG